MHISDIRKEIESIKNQLIERNMAADMLVYMHEEIEEKLKIQGLWAEWIMVEDDGTKFGLEKGIPPEALLGAILPPKATF